MYQPSQQKLGAILQNNGRKILDAIQSSLSCHAHHRPRVEGSEGRMVSKEESPVPPAPWYMLPGTTSHPGLRSPHSSRVVFCRPRKSSSRPWYRAGHSVHPARGYGQQISMVFTWCHLYWHQEYMCCGVSKDGATQSHRFGSLVNKGHKAHAKSHFQAILLSLEGRASSKEDYSQALKSHRVCLVAWICWGSLIPFFFPISPFCKGDVYPMPVPPSYFGSI